MLHPIQIEVLKADNCFNVYSDSLPGILATGDNLEDTINKYQVMAKEKLDEMVDKGEDLPDTKMTAIITVQVKEKEEK